MSGKRCHRWLDEEVIKFVRLYRNMECLWNVELRDHKDKNKRERAYEIIRDQMGVSGLTVLDVKKKIRGIRTTYSDELSKIAASLKGDKSVKTDAYQPKVFWFNLADSFLRGVTRHGSMTLKREESLYIEEPQHIDTEEDQDYSDHSHILEFPLYPERPNPEKEPSSSLANEDEYDLFGRSMAMQLRKLPELMSLELMQKMQLMVINAKKQLSKDKARTKMRSKSNAPSTSRKAATPSPESSGGSSPCYKFEVADGPASSTCEGTNYTYASSVQDNFPTLTSQPEPYTSAKAERELKRKHSISADPLEVLQNKQIHSSFKN